MPSWRWGVVAWLLVVAATSTVAWLAISRAGDQVLAAPAVARPSAGADAGTAGVDASGGTPTPRGTSTAAAGPAPGAVITEALPPPSTSTDPAQGSATSGVVPSTSGNAGPGPRATPPAPSRSAGTTAPAPAASTSAVQPAVQPVDRSVTVTGGQVTVRCTGGVVSLRAATPAGGWSVRVDPRGSTEVRIEFRAAEGSDGASEVHATCSGGVPQLEVDDASD